jgi:hypothetical protein
VFRAAFGLHVILSIEDIVLSGEAEQGVPVVGVWARIQSLHEELTMQLASSSLFLPQLDE